RLERCSGTGVAETRYGRDSEPRWRHCPRGRLRRLQHRDHSLQPRGKPGRWKFFGDDGDRWHVDLCARSLRAARRHSNCRRRGGRGYRSAGVPRGASRLGGKDHVAGIAIGRGVVGDDVHRSADLAEPAGGAVWRHQSARGLDHCHRSRQRLLPRLSGGEIFRCAAWATGGQYRRVQFRNPFDFLSVVGFAVFLGAIIVLGRAAGGAFGTARAVAGAIVVGLGDVDAITFSMIRLTPDPLGRTQAAVAILASATSGTLSKVAIGRGWFAADLAVMALGSLAVGGATAWLTFVLLA